MSINRIFPIIAVAAAMTSTAGLCAGKHVHAQAIKAPHGGEVLELDTDEYHAELRLNEKTHLITIYVLDGKAKQEVPISAPYLVVNVSSGDGTTEFRLVPIYREAKREGPTPFFAIKSDSLMKLLHTAGVNPQLTINMGEKVCVAQIAHRHVRGDAAALQK